MRQSAYQSVRPVIAAQSYLLLRSEFQTSMCAEMYQDIGSETVLCPKIRSNVVVWRSRIRTMYQFERVVSLSSRILRKKHNVSQIYAGQPQLTVFRNHVFARKIPVQSHDLGVFFRAKSLLYPSFILFFGNKFGIGFLYELNDGSFGIRTEYCSSFLDELGQAFGSCR